MATLVVANEHPTTNLVANTKPAPRFGVLALCVRLVQL